MNPHWHLPTLIINADQCYHTMRRNFELSVGENSLWWHFSHQWQSYRNRFLVDFVEGKHTFSPMTRYVFTDETHQSWCHLDRIMIKLLHTIIKPTFPHIVHQRCYHMVGPGGVKVAIRDIKRALVKYPFRYAIRTDIKSYYASIDRKILLEQLCGHFQDPRVQQYFEQIVHCAIEKGGDVFVPTTGIPRRSSLSPFFGALYLSELDETFSDRQGIQYFRYMDDIVILAQTQKQYQRAKKILFAILGKLRLQISPAKTKMGQLRSSFHFLGTLFEVTQIPQGQPQVSVKPHQRTLTRALDRVKALQENAVHPANAQRYLVRWATWWSHTIVSVGILSMLLNYLLFSAVRDPTASWVGRGLIPRAMLYIT